MTQSASFDLTGYGEARLVKREDGWYVELQGPDGVYAAGPTTKEVADQVWADIVSAVKPHIN